MPYRVLKQFQNLFDGTKYLHRRSNLGDTVAMQFYLGWPYIPVIYVGDIRPMKRSGWASQLFNLGAYD